MRACVQRVTEASVNVDGKVIGEIEQGVVVLLGVATDDTEADLEYLANKVAALRIFEDDEGKMNRSLTDVGGAMLVVSQFTLLGDCRKGRRPSYINAAEPAKAEDYYEQFVARIEKLGIKTATGKFRAMMQVALVNDGPVTLMLDSRKTF